MDSSIRRYLKKLAKRQSTKTVKKVTPMTIHAIIKRGKPQIRKKVKLGTLVDKSKSNGIATFKFCVVGQCYTAKSFRKGEENFTKFEIGKSYTVKGNILLPKSPQQKNKTENEYDFCLETVQLYVPIQSLKVVNTQFSFLKNVTILNGNIYRYIGCKFCSTSIKKPDGLTGSYICPTTTCYKYKQPTERIICMIIHNLSLRDGNGNTINDIVAYHDTCKLIFGATVFNNIIRSNYDEYSRKQFQRLVNQKVDCTIKHIPNKQEKIDKFGITKNVMKHVKFLKKVFEDDADYPTNNDNLDNQLFSLSISDASYEEEISSNKYNLTETTNGFIGLAMIINVNSYSNQHPREGSEHDVSKLLKILPEFGVEIFTPSKQGRSRVAAAEISNPMEEEFTSAIAEFKEKLIVNQYASLFFIFMGHGSFNQIQLGDDTRMNVFTDVICKFSEKEFPDFEGKPKVFIFNSCQGINENTDFKKSLNALELNVPFADMFWIFAGFPGQPARRNVKTGSVFIQSFLHCLEKSDNCNLERIMFLTQEKLKNEGKAKGEYIIPMYLLRLFRSFVFPKKKELPSLALPLF